MKREGHTTLWGGSQGARQVYVTRQAVPLLFAKPKHALTIAGGSCFNRISHDSSLWPTRSHYAMRAVLNAGIFGSSLLTREMYQRLRICHTLWNYGITIYKTWHIYKQHKIDAMIHRYVKIRLGLKTIILEREGKKGVSWLGIMLFKFVFRFVILRKHFLLE